MGVTTRRDRRKTCRKKPLSTLWCAREIPPRFPRDSCTIDWGDTVPWFLWNNRCAAALTYNSRRWCSLVTRPEDEAAAEAVWRVGREALLSWVTRTRRAVRCPEEVFRPHSVGCLCSGAGTIWPVAVDHFMNDYPAREGDYTGVPEHARCASRRLGRKLTRDDFTPAPVNATLHAVFDGCVVP